MGGQSGSRHYGGRGSWLRPKELQSTCLCQSFLSHSEFVSSIFLTCIHHGQVNCWTFRRAQTEHALSSIGHGQNASIRVIALDTLQRRSRGLVATVFDHIHRRKIGPCSTMLSCIRSVPDSSGAQVQWPTPHVWQFLLSSFCFQNDRQAAPRR